MQFDSGAAASGRVLRHLQSITVCGAFPDSNQRRKRAETEPGCAAPLLQDGGKSRRGCPGGPGSGTPEREAAATATAAAIVFEDGKKAAATETVAVSAAASAAAAAAAAADALLVQCAPPPRAGQVVGCIIHALAWLSSQDDSLGFHPGMNHPGMKAKPVAQVRHVFERSGS